MIVGFAFAGGNQCRLAVCFADEFRSVDVGYPDLDGPQALLAQPLAMPTNAFPGGWHTAMLHVTAEACGGAADIALRVVIRDVSQP